MIHPQVIVLVWTRSQITKAVVLVRSQRIRPLASTTGRAPTTPRVCQASETATAPHPSETF